jgi:hypothetical protein
MNDWDWSRFFAGALDGASQALVTLLVLFPIITIAALKSSSWRSQ